MRLIGKICCAMSGVTGRVTFWSLIVGFLLAGVTFGLLQKFRKILPTESVLAQQEVSAKPVTMPLDSVGVLITFGVTDKEPTKWSGEISVSNGQIISLTGFRLGAKMSVEDNRFIIWSRYAGPQQKAIISPQVFAVILAKDDATISASTKQGNFSAKIGDLSFWQPMLLLDGRVKVERVLPSFQLTRTPKEDDFPSVTVDFDGNLWLAYVAYTHGGIPDLSQPLSEEPKDFSFLVPKGNGDQILLTKFDGKEWSKPIPITEGGLDVWKPTVAAGIDGSIWVIWSQNMDGNWELLARRFDSKANRIGDIERLTNSLGSDFNASAAADRNGNIWVAWQSWQNDNFDILLMRLPDKKPIYVSESKANDWSPTIAVSKDGTVFLAWDTYDKGNYDVWMAEVRAGKIIRRPIAITPRFEARPHIAVDEQNRIWIAYEEDEVSWGKDFAGLGGVHSLTVAKFNKGIPLYFNRAVRVRCFAEGKLLTTIGQLRANFPKEVQRSISHPRIGVDGEGRVWLLFRHATNPDGSQENWMSYAVFYDGDKWSIPLPIMNSTNIMDIRPTLALVGGKTLLAIYSSDKRSGGTGSRIDSDLFATPLYIPIAANPPKLTEISPDVEEELQSIPPAKRRQVRQERRKKAAASGEYVPQETVHPNEIKDIARIRNFRLKIGKEEYILLRGEFHRHTEFTAHRDQDGTLEDAWRYALDAAEMDWMGLGDHDNGYHHEYHWWISQKVTDIFNHPPRFITVFTYERSVPYPSGHRNVLFAKRGIRPLPRLGGAKEEKLLMGTAETGSPDVKMLYRYLHEFGGVCASHTSATGMGTDWRDNDPEAEPIVEIYQGHRQNYEFLGAPRSATEQKESIGGWQPSGFVWNAFKKGYKLGFQCSSDHVSTHMSYAVVFAEKPTRQAIVDAFKKRHSYGATDNILLVVTSGDHIMGDAFVTNKPPVLEIFVAGTAPIAKLHIIKDFQHVYTIEPKRSEVKLRWQDKAAEKGKTSWYYVRVEQEDEQLAWSSPMWIHYE
ncbi:MAG: hypothetical protein RMK18_04110 [Armatimonadota bacterium]|nr:hypothetical protein [Armatimonadota bacterium]MCX7777206.1 hypothetical protein [Armatimonadota bacterium]MDW8025033.1 hypothetical protein [Armatimonadota bacterium]